MKVVSRWFTCTIAVAMAFGPLAAATAQTDLAVAELGPAEQAVLRTLDNLVNPGPDFPSGFGPTESPFGPSFDGTSTPFTLLAEDRLAIAAPLADQRPFTDDLFDASVFAFPPATNDYFANSPYIVVNTVEVSQPVSDCGPKEYREVALFLTRLGMPTIGENPEVLNDPGVGASEAVSLICTAGQSSTFFGLAENGALRQYALPYWVYEIVLDGRFFVSFLTLDPFASGQVVGSFAADTTVQADFGFVRGEATEYGAVVAPAEQPILDQEVATRVGDLIDDQSVPPGDVSTEQEPPAEESPAEDPPAEDPPAEEDPSAETGSLSNDSSLLPVFLGGPVGVGIIFGGVVLYRRKTVNLRGTSKPLLSDAEEVRLSGERAGLAKAGDWQLIPFATGREFRVRRDETKRENLVGDDRSSDVFFEGRPWQWSDAKERNMTLADHFGFWINSDGTLRVGSPTDPYQFDSLRDESEFPVDDPEPTAGDDDGPINLDGLYGGDGKGIPPA